MSVNRIVVTVEGGVVQSVGADRPADIEVYVVDLDVDGDHPTLCVIPEGGGDREESAYVAQPLAETLSPTERLWIAAAKANEEEE